MFDPWRCIEAYPHVEVQVVRLPDKIAGCTDGQTIYMDDRLTILEQRCVLTHELVHVHREHDGCQPPAVEREVRAQTARVLVPFDALQDALCWSGSLREVAEELHVTVPVLEDRLDILSSVEARKLRWN